MHHDRTRLRGVERTTMKSVLRALSFAALDFDRFFGSATLLDRSHDA
jgi:hypothetical protein